MVTVDITREEFLQVQGYAFAVMVMAIFILFAQTVTVIKEHFEERAWRKRQDLKQAGSKCTESQICG